MRTMRTWAEQRFGKKNRKRGRTFRPGMEFLEDRSVPAVVTNPVVNVQLDPSFSLDGKTTAYLDGTDDRGVAVVADALNANKVVVAGYTLDPIANYHFVVLARYDNDGTLDERVNTAFSTIEGTTTQNRDHKSGMVPTDLGADAYVTDIVQDATGRFIVTGRVDHSGSGTGWDTFVVRYKNSGAIDTTFGGGDGVVFVDYGGDDIQQRVAVDASNNVIVVGRTGSNLSVTRLEAADGDLDGTFSGDGKLVLDTPGSEGVPNSERTTAVAWQNNGIVIAASYQNGSVNAAVYRVTDVGMLDASFGEGDGLVLVDFGGTDFVRELALDPVSGIVLGGDSIDGGGVHRFALARLTNAGILDATFSGDGKLVATAAAGTLEEVSGLAVTSTSITIGGTVRTSGANTAFALARFEADGDVDNSFDGDGQLTTEFDAAEDRFGDLVQVGNKITAVGSAMLGGSTAAFNNYALARYDGAVLDTTFSTDGKATTELTGQMYQVGRTALQVVGGQEKILATGYSTVSGSYVSTIFRFNADGTLDTTFGTGGAVLTRAPEFPLAMAESWGIAVDSNGNIVTAGRSFGNQVVLFRFDADGNPDNTFSSDGIATVTMPAGFDGEGPVLVALVPGSTPGTQDMVVTVATSSLVVAKVSASGTQLWASSAASFAHGTFSRDTISLATDSLGRVYVGGETRLVSGGEVQSYLARFNADGTADLAFGGQGNAAAIQNLSTGGERILSGGILVQEDTPGDIKIVIMARAANETTPSTFDLVLARYDATGAVDATFGTAGKARLVLGVANNNNGGIVRLPDGGYLTAYFAPSASAGNNALVARWTATGQVDLNFGSTGTGFITYDLSGLNDAARSIVLVDGGESAIIQASTIVPRLTGETSSPPATAIALFKMALDRDAVHLNEGGTYATAGGFTDPDNDGPWIAEVNYGEGAGFQSLPLNGFAFNLSNVYDTVGTYTVTVRVTDSGGNFGTVTQTVIVDSLPPTKPTVVNTTINEGQGITAASTDPEDETLTFRWDFDANGSYEFTTTSNFTVTWAQLNTIGITSGPSSRQLRVQVDDGHGNTVLSDVVTITVNNTAPPVNLLLDPTFGANGLATVFRDAFPGMVITNAEEIAQQSLGANAGKFVFAGKVTKTSSTGVPAGTYVGVWRLNTNGTIDTSFGADYTGDGQRDGIYLQSWPGNNNPDAQTIGVDSQDRIVVGGRGNGNAFLMARFTPNGTPDNTFSGDGVTTTEIVAGQDQVWELYFLKDGTNRIVASGSVSTDGVNRAIAIARYLDNGELDPSFAGDGTTFITYNLESEINGRSMTVDNLGRILLTGSYQPEVPDNDEKYPGKLHMVRFNTDGSPDTSFGDGGTVLMDFGRPFQSAGDVLVQPDGKIVTVGQMHDLNQSTAQKTNADFLIARFNDDGTLDTTFGGGDGYAVLELGLNTSLATVGIERLANGDFLTVFSTYTATSGLDYLVARWSASGVLDTSFGSNGLASFDFAGLDDEGRDILLTDNGKAAILMGKSRTAAGSHVGVAKILISGEPRTIVEGSTVAVSGSFSDPGAETWTGTVNYGEVGGLDEILTWNPNKTFTINHLYSQAGTYTITVKVNDGNAIGTATVQVVVTEGAPTATFLGGPPVPQGNSATVSFSNQSDSPVDTTAGFKYSYDFNNDGNYEIVDSSSPTANVPGSFMVSPGYHTIRGRIKDQNGSSTEYTTAVVAVETSETVGIFNPANATWYFRNGNGAGGPDVNVFAYGFAGGIELIGDWDGDGVDTIGIYNPANATWYLRNSNTPGAPDFTPFAYGFGGVIPVVGDWNGDGIDTIGVYNPANATWYLRNSNSAGAPDITPFAYGFGNKPVVGDWNGDGIDTVGIFSTGDAKWYLKNSNSVGAPSISPFAYGFGTNPVVGDWNGDGVDSVGIYNPGNASWYLRDSNNAGAPTVPVFAYGFGNRPVVGNWFFSTQTLGSANGEKTPTTAGNLLQSELDDMVEAALTRLQNPGIAQALLARLQNVTFEVGNLAPGQLAQAFVTQKRVVIDRNAAGHSWFLDSTPQDDTGGVPAGQMDLLTVVLRELGHMAGRDAVDLNGHATDLMASLLGTGTRRTALLSAVFAGQ